MVFLKINKQQTVARTIEIIAGAAALKRLVLFMLNGFVTLRLYTRFINHARKRSWMKKFRLFKHTKISLNSF
jgi:riboflavin transporter FmnP